VNTWLINEALSSVRRAREVIPRLTEAEVLAALKLELGSRRRKHMVSQLQAQATKLYQQTLTKE
jgi:hypothetical protein